MKQTWRTSGLSLATALATACLPVLQAAATVIATDNFESYTAGAVLNGGSGGTGWPAGSNWVSASTSVTVENGIIPGFGKSCQDAAVGTQANVLYRAFPAQSGTLYVGFVVRTPSGFESSDLVEWIVNNKTGHTSSDTDQMGAGVNSSAGIPYMARAANTLVNSAVSHADGVSRRVVFKISKSATTYNRTDLFVDQLVEGTPSATANVDSGLTQVSYVHLRTSGTDTGEKSYWENLRIATTYAEAVSPFPPTVNNASGATGVGATAATLNGTLLTTGALSTAVFAYWGTSNGGTNAASWQNTNTWAAPRLTGAHAWPLSGLTGNRGYFYTFSATNAVGRGWATPSSTFITAALTVQAPDAIAGENATAGGNGTFRIGRPLATTNAALTVAYRMSGTASNGVDYTALNGSAAFLAGQTNVDLTVAPLADSLAEGNESVTLTLLPGPYMLGATTSAVVNIRETTWYVAPAPGGNDATHRGTNGWPDALATISNAVSKASAGDVVLVSNGLYSITALITVSKGITVRSLSGASKTIVKRGGASSHGIFSVSDVNAVIDGVTMTNGSATGGGLTISAGSVSNCVIGGNSGRWAGGVDMTGTGSPVLRNCIITNTASGAGGAGDGGGIRLGGTAGTPLVRECVIANNRSGASVGGGVTASRGTLRNCIVMGNSGTGGAGVYINNALCTVESCTITRNISASTGGGLTMTAGTVQNTIIHGNTTSPSHNPTTINVNKTGGTFAYGCSFPLISGGSDVNNTAVDPGFENAAANNLRLMPGSPCIDTGMTLAAVARDIEGAARPLDGNGDATPAHDMGAYEAGTRGAGALRCGFSTPVQQGFTSLPVVLTGAAAGGDLAGLSYWWDFTNDGSYDVSGTGRQVVTNMYGVGLHAVKLAVSNGVGAVSSRTRTAYIYVAPRTNYVARGAGNAFPYDTWAKAATNLQPAINAALVLGGTSTVVVVSNGPYRVSSPVTVSNAITVRSANGRDATVVARAAGSINVVSLYSAGCVFDGFTVTNGNNGTVNTTAGTTIGSVGGMYVAAGTARNCAIGRGTGKGVEMGAGMVTDSLIWNNNARGGAGVNFGGAGTVRNCRIWGNYSSSGGAGSGGGVTLNSAGLVDRCVITNNNSDTGGDGGGVYINGSGTLRNSLVAKNRARHGAGVYLGNAGGTIENSTIADNTSYSGGSGGGVNMSVGTARNLIVYNNLMTPSAGSNNVYKTGGTFDYSCATPLVSGTGNRDGSPNFTAGYHTDVGSAALDTGMTIAAVTNDLDGAVRPQDGDGVGGNVYDMGCYEKPTPVGEPLRCDFSTTPPTPNGGVGSLAVVFTANTTGGSNTNFLYRWDLNNDGSFDVAGAGRRIVTNTYGVGLYTINLVVSNAAGQVTNKLRTGWVYVAPRTAYVATNGTHTFPYDTWTKAATNVQHAVNAARVSGTNYTTVIVSNGIHRVSSSVAISNAITLRSLSGRAVTFVQPRSGATVKMLTVGAPGAVVDGLTIRGGSNGGVEMTENGVVRNCAIVSNLVNNSGIGGIRLTAGTVEDCDVRYNQCRGGGGIRIDGVATARRCTVSNNRSDLGGAASGGGVMINAGGLVEQCVITNNASGTMPGGGVYINSAGAVLRNCVVLNNTGTGGAGVRIDTSGGTVENCTLSANNGGTGSGGGLSQSGGTVRNTIVYGNTMTPANATYDEVFKSGGVFTYSCSTPLVTGGSDVNNTALNPNLDATCHLGLGSSAIDSGMTIAAVTNDLSGAARPEDGNGDSVAAYDMGAYERPASAAGEPLQCDFVANVEEGITSLAVVFTASTSGGSDSNLVYRWDFTNDGTFDATGAGKRVVTNTYGVGLHDVELVVSNGIGEVTNKLRAGLIYVAPATVYVATNGTHAFPFRTWAQAATNVQQAIDAARVIGTNACLVLVSNGTYGVSSSVTVNKAITVRSVNGRDATTIRRTSANIKVLTVQVTGAVVDGFTLRDGPQGGAVISAGTVRNCTIRNNAGEGVDMTGGVLEDSRVAYNTNRGQPGVRMTGAATVRRCTLDRNQGTYADGSGVGLGVYMTAAGLVENCTIANNYNNTGTANMGKGGGAYLSAGTLRNCLVVSNSYPGLAQGGGVCVNGAAARVENCTVVANRVGSGGGGGVYMAAGSVTNSIVHSNTMSPDTPADNNVKLAGGTMGYSCSTPLVTGPGNKDVDPLFLAPAAGNYRLRPTSPLANFGVYQSWMATAVDLDGNPRVVSAVDMGCFEATKVTATLIILR